MKIKNLKIFKKIILHFLLSFFVLIFSFFIFSEVNAASLYFSPSEGSYGAGLNFSVGVFISSPDQLINAVGGTILFPQDKLEITSVSKTGSIITFWAREPNFSNAAGTINFEGVILPNGFRAGVGRIITLNFRTKTAGTASIRFSEGSILAHDGQGTNVLRNLGIASYIITDREITPIPPAEGHLPTQVPSAPSISSLTHPDADKWYSNNSPEFFWDLTPDITAVRTLINKNPNSIPTVTHRPPISEKKLENLEDGIWYFHIRFQNQHGWGRTTHRKIMIDTVSPLPFLINVQKDDLTDPSPILFFETKDELSGIEHYEIKIEKKELFLLDKIKEYFYKLSPQPPGVHKIKIFAYDLAGNYSQAETKIQILPIETPIITKYSKIISPGENFILEGKALPNIIVKIFLERKGENSEIKEIKSNSDGTWFFISDSLREGDWRAWVQAKDERGALSLVSEKINFQVRLPYFIKIGKIIIDYLTIIVTFIVLIIGALIIIFYGWYRISLWRKKVKNETKEINQAVLRAFRILRKEVEREIEFLDGKIGINENEKKVRDNLKEALDISERFIEKEIKDVEKKLK